MFVDSVKIRVKAGAGGRGCVAFRREKFVPFGGPSGGDGGNGGDVIIEATNRMHTLLDLRFQQLYRAGNGKPGLGSNMHGARGRSCVVSVPLGTMIKDLDTGEVLADLIEEEETYVAVSGGRGGKGNAHFKSSRNRVPRYAQPGESAEETLLRIELKLIADIGIIGLPNAGKSTLLSRISHSRPKIADYPFTTLVPNLGMVDAGDYRSFIAADIPGLIEGAHEGKGLGIRFLKHIERTKILLHTVDLADTANGSEDMRNIELINHELSAFSPELARKPQVVAGNKTDVPEAAKRCEALRKILRKKEIPFFPISAVTGAGIRTLMNYLMERIENVGNDGV